MKNLTDFRKTVETGVDPRLLNLICVMGSQSRSSSVYSVSCVLLPASTGMAFSRLDYQPLLG